MTISGNWLQNVDYAARIDRQVLEALTNGEGTVGMAAFKGTLNGGTLSIDLDPGLAIVQGDDQANQGRYAVLSDTSENVTFTAPGSNSKYVGICLKVQDPNATGDPGDNVILTTVDGTSGSSPSKPNIPDSHLLLYWVLVANTDTVGTDCTLEDARNDVQAVPSGSLLPWAAPINAPLPAGYLRADGSAVSRTTYASLFHVIGTTYGSGDGSTSFNLPDLAGRVPVGVDDMGAGDAGRLSANQTLGDTGGVEKHALTTGELAAHDHGTNTGSTTASHTHGDGSLSAASNGSHSHGDGSLTTASAGAHTHELLDTYYRQNGQPVGRSPSEVGATGPNRLDVASAGAHTHNVTGSTDSGGSHTHSVTGTTASGGAAHTHSIASEGSNNPHENMPPYVAVSYLIKT